MFCPNEVAWGSVGDWVSGLGALAAVGTALWIAIRQRADAKADRAEARKNYAAMVWAAVQRVGSASLALEASSERVALSAGLDALRHQASPLLKEIELLRLFRPYRELDNSVIAMSMLEVERACADFVAEFEGLCDTERKVHNSIKEQGFSMRVSISPKGVLEKVGPISDACAKASKLLASAD